ncbi:MAG: nicotinamide-nucleotide adenylyltransferase [Thermoplasmata archaeon]
MTEKEGSSELPALFIGRFQPFHRGHLFMTRKILEDFDHLIIGVGSAQYSHTRDNPFSYEERSTMIGLALEMEGLDRCRILPIDDVHNHSTWVSFVESVVPSFGVVFSNDPLTTRLFQEKGYDVMELTLHNREDLSGTEVRERMASGRDWENLVPNAAADYIKDIKGGERVKDLQTSWRGKGQEGDQSDQ